MRKLSLHIYLIYAPLIGLSIFVLAIHSMMLSADPSAFMDALMTPAILFSMLIYLMLGLIFCYLIGAAPALISAEIFSALMRRSPQQRQLLRYLYCGFFATIPWAILALICILLFPDFWAYSLFFYGITLISSLLCAAYIWRKMSQLDFVYMFE